MLGLPPDYPTSRKPVSNMELKLTQMVERLLAKVDELIDLVQAWPTKVKECQRLYESIRSDLSGLPDSLYFLARDLWKLKKIDTNSDPRTWLSQLAAVRMDIVRTVDVLRANLR